MLEAEYVRITRLLEMLLRLNWVVVYVPIFTILVGLSLWLRERLYKYIGSGITITAWIPILFIQWAGLIDAVYPGNERSWLSYDTVKIIEVTNVITFPLIFIPHIGGVLLVVLGVTTFIISAVYLYCSVKLCEFINVEPVIVVVVSIIPVIGVMIADTILYKQAVKSGQFE